MERSPLVRFVLAGLLIVFIVSLTFMYGNAQRSKQIAQSNKARQESLNRQSEAKRDQQKLPAPAPAKTSEGTSTPSVTKPSSSSPTVDSSLEVVDQSPAPASTSTQPQMPATGGSSSLSFALGTTMIGALALALLTRRYQLAL